VVIIALNYPTGFFVKFAIFILNLMHHARIKQGNAFPMLLWIIALESYYIARDKINNFCVIKFFEK
jgi:hypothetical protein